MQRHLLTAALLLLLTAAAQAMTPARQDANGSGGSCPEAHADESTEPEVADAAAANPDPRAAPAVAPRQAKVGAADRPRSGTRWHSYLPGMFK
jgi:hypothetical protein